MATLVLTAVGNMVGGPVGGAIGAIVGQQIDARLFAPKGRKGPRLGDLTVQTSSYGSAIPKIFGTMRVAGTVIWSTDLRESRTKQGGGKGRPSTTTYSYSASFAVALSGRRIAGVRRIWADGKLLRGEAGDFKTATGFRFHPGDEVQTPDPAVAAAEGMADAPAFRGVAYAVFEDFQLGDYGNRIPSLTFELVADANGTSAGAVAAELSGGAIVAEEPGLKMTGFAAHGDSVRAVLAVLGEAAPVPLVDDGERLRLGRDTQPPRSLGDGGTDERRRAAAGQVPDTVSIGYYDPARDFQAGLQRASHRHVGSGVTEERRGEQIALPAAMEAGAAKALASARLAELWRGRERRGVTLPWREIGTGVGRLVRVAADGPGGRVWRVVGWTLERMAVRLDLVAHAGAAMAPLPAVAGRAAAAADLVHGPTTLHLFDAPPLRDGESGPRLLLAAAGSSAGWRGAALEISTDGGGTWSAAGYSAPAATMGRVSGVLGPGGSELIDARHAVEVQLLRDDMWLESRDDDALAGGANLAMIGDELVQFGRAEPLEPGRFRLSRLLRGRRGSEWAAAHHRDGERFVLLEPENLLSLPLPAELAGGVAQVAARGLGDEADPPLAAHAIGTEAVRPPSPAHLRYFAGADGAVVVEWTRRSRAGWGWVDGVDAPLGEAREAYRVTLTGGGATRTAEIDRPTFTYDAAMQAADGVTGGLLQVEVVQLGSLAASRPVWCSVQLQGRNT